MKLLIGAQFLVYFIQICNIDHYVINLFKSSNSGLFYPDLHYISCIMNDLNLESTTVPIFVI